MFQRVGMNDDVDRRIRKAHSLHVELREGMKRVLRQNLEESRQIFGGINFDYSELANRGIVATEILETAGEPERSGHCRGQRHRSQIIAATRATKSLL